MCWQWWRWRQWCRQFDTRQFLQWQSWLEKLRDYWLNTFYQKADAPRWRIMQISLRSCRFDAFIAAAQVKRKLTCVCHWGQVLWTKSSSELLWSSGSFACVCVMREKVKSNKLWKLSRIRWQKSLFWWVENFYKTESVTIKLHEVSLRLLLLAINTCIFIYCHDSTTNMISFRIRMSGVLPVFLFFCCFFFFL